MQPSILFEVMASDLQFRASVVRRSYRSVLRLGKSKKTQIQTGALNSQSSFDFIDFISTILFFVFRARRTNFRW